MTRLKIMIIVLVPMYFTAKKTCIPLKQHFRVPVATLDRNDIAANIVRMCMYIHHLMHECVN